MSASCVTISNNALLSRSETGVNPGIRRWKKHLSEWARCQKAIGGVYFTKKRRAETLQPWFRIWQFPIQARKWYLQMHLLDERFVFFRGDDRGFVKEGVKTYLMAPLSPLNSSFCLHIYSLYLGVGPALWSAYGWMGHSHSLTDYEIETSYSCLKKIAEVTLRPVKWFTWCLNQDGRMILHGDQHTDVQGTSVLLRRNLAVDILYPTPARPDGQRHAQTRHRTSSV